MTVRIEDVARRAGVSISTVSRALRGLANVRPATRQKVLQAAADLNYSVNPSASRLAAGRTLMVGVVGEATNWFTARVVAAAQEQFAAAGYDTVLEGPDLGRGPSGGPLPHRDGLLFVDVAAIDSRVSAPVVAVGRRLPGSPSVSVDAAAAAETGIRLLRRDGHRAIGLIGCAEGSATAMSMADVQSGFDSVAREGGVALHGTAIVASDATFEGGADAVTQLLCQWPPPSAVLAASDNVAAGARWAASAAGLVVPGELSIAGFGGSSVAANGDLTTLALPAARMGELAATSLLQAIEGVEVASAVVQAELIVRGSTGRTRSATSTQSGAQTAAPTREPM